MKRRSFLQHAAVSAFTLPLLACTPTQHAPSSSGYFRLEQRKDRWWFITPEGKPFFSMGLNHIDPATMHYPENRHLWKERYGGSTIRWIKESVAPNLKKWGFNTVGWVQEVSVRQWAHSRSFTHEEFQALGMPYCKMLPFTQMHQWEQHTTHFDFFSKEWEEWCEYVARAHCAELSEDPNLIGYWYNDCPTWIHTQDQNQWRGPVFDPTMLETEAGRKEISRIATKYYQTTRDAIRLYDPNHLILGDRYEANAPIAMEVIEAAMPYVDVLSFQDFRDPVSHMDQWHEKTGKPVLVADSARIKWQTKPGEISDNNTEWYREVLHQLIQNPGCVGFHLCGAYQRNRARRYGLIDELENPDEKAIANLVKAHQEVEQWMKGMFE